jgi:hypothetical protein
VDKDALGLLLDNALQRIGFSFEFVDQYIRKDGMERYM